MLTALVRSINNKLESFDARLSKLESQLKDNNNTPSERLFEDCVQEALYRLKKSNNLIVVGLPEPTGSNADEKDREAATELIAKIDPAATLTSVRRLGTPRNNHSRLTMLSVSCNDSVKTLLRKKNKLIGTKYSKIKLREDQTRHQLDYLKQLRIQLQERVGNGEQLTIKYIQNLPTIVPLDKGIKN